MDDMDQYAQYTEKQLGDNLLAQIAQTARDIVEAQERVSAAEEALTAAKSALRELQEERMPELMDAAGQDEVTTSDGLRVQVRPMIRASIPKASHDQALQWLRDNGHGGVIKNKLTVEFSTRQDEKAEETFMDLRKQGLPAALNKSVHAQTLQALIRELLTGGKDVPLQVLGAHCWKQAVVSIKE